MKENRDLRQEKREAEKKLNYWKERHARLLNKYRKVTSSNKPSSKKTRYEKEEEKRRKRERKKRRKGANTGRWDFLLQEITLKHSKETQTCSSQ